MSRQIPCSVGQPVDLGADGAQRLGEPRVAAVDVMRLGHLGRRPGRRARRAPGRRRPGCRGRSTGAPESRGTPRTTAWWPSVRRSAPSRASSWANMNRASKTFSVIIAVPCADRGQRHRERLQVGREAGVGQRRHVEARQPPVDVRPEAAVVDRRPSAPAGDQLVQRRCRGGRRRRPRRGPSPPAIAAAKAQVPATMRSVTVVVLDRRAAGRRPRPSASRWRRPSIRAPIATSIWHRSTISGSRATLSMTVVPSARTAAISRFSVAPTVGKSSQRSAPRSRSATSATTWPCSMCTVAPRSRSPAMCMSSPREPIASPPGSATLARPQRATSGPSTRSRPAGGVPGRRAPRGRAPRARRCSPSPTLPRRGVGVDRVLDLDRAAEPAQQVAHDVDVEDVRARCARPSARGASSAAAISFSARFLAPPTCDRARERARSGPCETTRKRPIAAAL